jgi:hypothetical protein
VPHSSRGGPSFTWSLLSSDSHLEKLHHWTQPLGGFSPLVNTPGVSPSCGACGNTQLWGDPPRHAMPSPQDCCSLTLCPVVDSCGFSVMKQVSEGPSHSAVGYGFSSPLLQPCKVAGQCCPGIGSLALGHLPWAGGLSKRSSLELQCSGKKTSSASSAGTSYGLD